MEILETVQRVPIDDLSDYILDRAMKIVRNTQGESWDDPEDWQIEAVELAHAIIRESTI